MLLKQFFSFFLDKQNTCHSSSDDDTIVDKDKLPNDNTDCKKVIDLLKQESKSIDGVLERKSKNCLETLENEVAEEVCFYLYLYSYLIIYIVVSTSRYQVIEVKMKILKHQIPVGVMMKKHCNWQKKKMVE